MNELKRQYAENPDGHLEKNLETFFYTSRGHKLRIRLDVNGNGDYKNISVSIFSSSFDGLFDDAVKWPIEAKIVFIVPQKKHTLNTKEADAIKKFQDPRTKKEEEKNETWGPPNFIPHEDLDKATQNDTLTVQIKMEYF